MANRREILTAVNLTINIGRNNDAMWWIENALQNINPSTGQPFVLQEYIPINGEEPPPQLTLEEQVKEGVKSSKKELKRKAKAIKDVLVKAPQEHISKGLLYFAVVKADLEYDTTESDIISENMDIEPTNTFPEFLPLSIPFVNYQFKLMKSFDPRQLPKPIQNANIVNSVIDAMAWELRGFNENTGEPHGRTPEQFDKLIVNRVYVAEVHLSHLSDTFEDVADLRTAVAYIKQYYKTKNNEELAGYLDSNIPKNISIRKAWSM